MAYNQSTSTPVKLAHTMGVGLAGFVRPLSHRLTVSRLTPIASAIPPTLQSVSRSDRAKAPHSSH